MGEILPCQRPALEGPRPAPIAAPPAALALEERWGTAVVQHDSAALDSLVAPDYVGIYPTRRDTKRALLVSVANPSPRQFLGSDPDPSRQVRVYGNAAVVTGVGDHYRESDGVETVMRTVYTEVFMWRDARWQCVAGQYAPLLTPR